MILALINIGSETEQMEYKKSIGELKEAMFSIVAILNKHQKGELYFGVKNDGTVIGQEVLFPQIKHQKVMWQEIRDQSAEIL